MLPYSAFLSSVCLFSFYATPASSPSSYCRVYRGLLANVSELSPSDAVGVVPGIQGQLHKVTSEALQFTLIRSTCIAHWPILSSWTFWTQVSSFKPYLVPHRDVWAPTWPPGTNTAGPKSDTYSTTYFLRGRMMKKHMSCLTHTVRRQ